MTRSGRTPWLVLGWGFRGTTDVISHGTTNSKGGAAADHVLHRV
jgi:hypothetical protein